MAHPQTLPYGSWPTPITSALVVASAVGLADVRADRGDLLWSEARPHEGGRTQLIRCGSDGAVTELLEASHNARTAVHEYGGGAWWAHAGVVWFTEWQDQRLYRLDRAGRAAVPLTPEPTAHCGFRYADGDVSPDGRWIVCVREHHPAGERGATGVRNEIVILPADAPAAQEVLVTGPDFVASPRWDIPAKRLCWIEWDHPNMPWDGTRLVVGDLVGGGQTAIAGGPAESVSQPQWQPDGSLTFISDRTGWWNIYRWSDGVVEPLVEVEAEIGGPEWVFAVSRYAVLDDGRIVFARSGGGFDALSVRLIDGTISELDLPFTQVRTLRAFENASVVMIAGTPTQEAGIYRVDLGEGSEVEALVTVRPPRDLAQLGIAEGCVSQPASITFPSARGRHAHGLFYAPRNSEFTGPPEERPPLLVFIHGGPTSEASAELRLAIQYWTSRGFAVVDVNYAGSTGYGRAYRDLLRGTWGVADVEDCMAAARWLAEQGQVDAARLCIRGGSAGGFTTLMALARPDTPFAAGADLFGVADLEALVRDTHKFESRYLDTLIGPYPEARDLYRERSPIHHVDAFARPLIVLQGLEDEVVPPNQSLMIVKALRAKGVPVAYVGFEGEQHGFRRAENIRRALDAELSFYAQVFGFDLPEHEQIEPVELS